MATLRSVSSDITGEHRQGLCPVCRSQRVTIRSLLDVQYVVEAAPDSGELVVLGEQVASSGWDETDRAGCGTCGWRGQVSDLTT